SVLFAGRRRSRRSAIRRLSPRLSSAEPAGHRQWQRPGLYPVPWILCHADPAGHPQGHDDLAAHQSTDRGPAGVGVRVCDRGGSTCRHPRSARRLQSIRRPRSPMGLAFMQRHIPLIFANLVAIFLLGPMTIIVPISLSSAISFEFSPPGYWLGYSAQFFYSAPWLNATLNSFIVAFGTMALTLLVALPAAFGLVRYRFRGKTG